MFSLQSFAQITFEKVIDTLTSASAYCIRQTLDGGFVFCGNNNLNGNDIQVIKLDSSGNITWVKSFSGPGTEGATAMEQLLDSTYIVHGIFNSGINSQSWLIGLDTSGDSLWSQLYSIGPGATNAYFGNSMAVMNSLTGIIGYYDSQPASYQKGYFFDIIGNGTVLGSKVYDFSPYGTQPMAISKTSNNEFIITGAIGAGTVSNDIFLIRTDVFGDTIWLKTYDFTQNDTGFDVIATSDNGILIAAIVRNLTISVANICLIKTNAQGDTLWTRIFPHNFEQLPYSIGETPDGGFIIAGTTVGGTPINSNVYLLKVNSTGDSLWSHEFGGVSSDGALSVQPLGDGFILSGFTSSFGNGGSYVIRTDSLGNITTGINEIMVSPFEFEIFPNPCTDELKIKLNKSDNSKLNVTVYNSLGTPILSDDNVIVQSIKINTSKFNSGVYFVRIWSDHGNSTRRFIKL